MPGGLCFGGLPFGLEAMTLQILGFLLFPADQACIVRQMCIRDRDTKACEGLYQQFVNAESRLSFNNPAMLTAIYGDVYKRQRMSFTQTVLQHHQDCKVEHCRNTHADGRC